ncbi:hypothetical protein LINPERPRIM_LOCUS18407 [Linum perenne]
MERVIQQLSIEEEEELGVELDELDLDVEVDTYHLMLMHRTTVNLQHCHSRCRVGLDRNLLDPQGPSQLETLNNSSQFSPIVMEQLPMLAQKARTRLPILSLMMPSIAVAPD